jgi:hypothetical protein
MSAVLSDDIRIEATAHAKVDIRPGVGATEYRITGSLPHVFEAIAAVFNSWPSIGYGTLVHTIQTVDYSGDYVCRMSRSNSCD